MQGPFEIVEERDVHQASRAAGTLARTFGMDPIGATLFRTAVTELAHNLIQHAGGGSISFDTITDGTKTGLRAVVRDEGPGMPDVEAALVDGYSTRQQLGLGLPGTRRMMDEFEIHSTARGTVVTITRWSRK